MTKWCCVFFVFVFRVYKPNISHRHSPLHQLFKPPLRQTLEAYPGLIPALSSTPQLSNPRKHPMCTTYDSNSGKYHVGCAVMQQYSHFQTTCTVIVIVKRYVVELFTGWLISLVEVLVALPFFLVVEPALTDCPFNFVLFVDVLRNLMASHEGHSIRSPFNWHSLTERLFAP